MNAMNENEALAQFARTVAAAADELRSTLDDAPVRDRWETISPPLGPRQRRILAMDRIDTQRGMSVAELKEANGRGGPQMGQVLETLERRGLLERVPSSSPPRFRLTPAYRTASTPSAVEGVRAAADSS
jgi:predicted transcriptional regulator